MSYEKLTKNRKLFIEQLYDLINNQFKEQEKLTGTIENITKELENNPDYIQRIFIDAPWGMGKTYFAEALEEIVKIKNGSREKEIEAITINSWQTDYFSDPMKSIIGEINNHNLINIETQQAAEDIVKNIFKISSKFLLTLFLKKFNLKNEDIEKLKSIFTGINTSELEDYKNYKKLVDKFKEKFSSENKLKLIVIDELDRCKPNYAIELLETIKHFFGVKNIIFVFLVNKEQLKSIISTSYLTEDKCSEYFEKFFDIEFKLPEIEYEDFLDIEYNKYNDLSTYNAIFAKQNLDSFEYVSDEKERFYELIFLEAVKSNCNGKNLSVRNFIKSFKKFTILLSSLSSEVKNIYPLIIVLILYFIREEFFNKNKNLFPIKLLFAKTFFIERKINLNSLPTEQDIYSKVNVKNEYLKNHSFYKIFYLILLFETSKKEHVDEYYTKYTYGFKLNNEEKFGNIALNLNKNQKVFFNSLKSYVQNGVDYDLILNEKLFNDLNKDRFRVGESSYYSVQLLEEWAKLKYNFILNG